MYGIRVEERTSLYDICAKKIFIRYCFSDENVIENIKMDEKYVKGGGEGKNIRN